MFFLLTDLVHEDVDVIVLLDVSAEESVEGIVALDRSRALLFGDFEPAGILISEIGQQFSERKLSLDVHLSFDLVVDIVAGQGSLHLGLVGFSRSKLEPVGVLAGVDHVLGHLIINYKHSLWISLNSK